MRKFLLDLAFPASPQQNLAIFLFLIVLLIASLVGPTESYFLGEGFANEVGKMARYSGADESNSLATMFASFQFITVSIMIFGMVLLFAWLTIMILLGKAKHSFIGGGINPNRRIFGLSLALYGLGIIGSSFSEGHISLTSLYFALLIMIGFMILNSHIIAYANDNENHGIENIRVIESLFGTLVSGGFFLYYWQVVGQGNLTSIISAYASFTICLSAYRLFQDTFSKRTA